MMVPFLWMIVDLAQDPGRGLRDAAAQLPVGAALRELREHVERLPERRDVRDVLPELDQARPPLHGRPARHLLDGRLRVRGASRSAAAGRCSRLLLATLIIPFQVVLVPNFILYRTLPHPLSASGNWIGTQEPLWVGAWLGGAFGTFLLRQFFLAIPRELADAARVDGANPWQIFTQVYVPLARPALATLAIFTFMWTWNDLLNPLIYLSDLDQYTTTVGLALLPGPVRGQVAGDDGRRPREPRCR